MQIGEEMHEIRLAWSAMEVPLATWLVISIWMPCHLLQHPLMVHQWRGMPDWLQSMCTVLKSGSTSLRSSNAIFTLAK
jgi:hypothetical protein